MLSHSKHATAFCDIFVTQVALKFNSHCSVWLCPCHLFLTVTQLSDSVVNILCETCTASFISSFLLGSALQSREIHGSDLLGLLFYYHVQNLPVKEKEVHSCTIKVITELNSFILKAQRCHLAATLRNFLHRNTLFPRK